MKTVKSKWMLIALLVSVAINLSIAGFVGAQWFRHSGMRASQTSLMFDRRAALSTLEDTEKKNINQIWKAHRPELKEKLRNFRHSKRTLSKLLSANHVDEATINAAFAEMAEHRNKVEGTLYSALLETAQALPPEKRKKFFWRGFKRWKNRHHMNNHFKSKTGSAAKE
ncbi:hypothetical protein A9Q83_00240 [Alphaproteobacteria bacterium 46_93_T64]|nr:hypothetical protein A9Q83_00240 [Alphaproteobacteria bacterium 46_93_T64]